MARDTTDLTPIDSVDDLTLYMKGGEKPKAQFRIGTEHEKFGFYADTLGPVPYEGERGIRRLLEGMQALSGWEAITDDGRIIGLAGASGQGAISLEPGGQFELSGAPLETIHQTCRESNAHLSDVRKVAKDLGIEFLGMGSSPTWTLAETPIMPKSRYDIMRNYMPKVGTRGLDMMFRTCTIQVNLDFADEADMRRKMQIGMKLQPVATALFANSPFTEGKPNGLVSWRSDVWRDVDNQRSGLLPFVFEPGFTYRHYVEWALDVPMYFVMRDGVYHDATDITFRQFLDGGFKGRVADATPNFGDWTNHLSTLFPDVRLKRFIEMRGADGGPWRRICALPALWVGLLYDEAAMAEAEALCADWTFEEVSALREAVPTTGFATEFRDASVLELSRAVVAIARKGLKARARMNEEGNDESHFLAPLEEVVARGTTSAEELVRLYETQWDRSMAKVFAHLVY
ncbi:glutamate--cysteine ligase [Aureimonas altamirensis DSM 21988]|uniref:Glutamate--cysteine ligase n=1 Tax=Aureimonas altamirensis DSM 21988 TaxID=1121026 RepID=A0ABY1IH75_9HYPH|nr:glutamate--cysteine ligase [Aureimonas altamirensis]SHJ17040.1 glutamate--cysteine ligase [Aureimonas altamirensis DSM 21988]